MLLGATNISSGRKRILLMIFSLPLNLNPICIYFHDFRDKIGDNYVNPLLKSKSEKSIKYSFGFVPSKWKTPIYFFLSGRQKFRTTIILFFCRWYENNFGNNFAPNISYPRNIYFAIIYLSNHARNFRIFSTFSQILFFAGVLASGTGQPQNTASQVRFLFVSGEIWWISFLCPFIVFILGRGGTFFRLCFHRSLFLGHDRFSHCLFLN